MNSSEIAILAGGYLLLLATSGIAVNRILSKISGEPISQKIGKEARDTGFIIGKCENLLIPDFYDSGGIYSTGINIRCKNRRS